MQYRVELLGIFEHPFSMHCFGAMQLQVTTTGIAGVLVSEVTPSPYLRARKVDSDHSTGWLHGARVSFSNASIST